MGFLEEEQATLFRPIDLEWNAPQQVDNRNVAVESALEKEFDPVPLDSRFGPRVRSGYAEGSVPIHGHERVPLRKSL
jgi:hypothetical protein